MNAQTVSISLLQGKKLKIIIFKHIKEKGNKMNAQNLADVLKNHRKWISRESGGIRADLRGANLQEANLRRADLREANLQEANLQEADLQGANLQGADLRGADLWGANLRGADLRGANLQGANLRVANLWRADLSPFSIIPEGGSFIGWKKCRNNVVIKLQIPAGAKRVSCLTGRKCRAEYVKVLEVIGAQTGIGMRNDTIIYKKDKTIRADKFDPDIRFECSNGIHFFITRKEAEDYNI